MVVLLLHLVTSSVFMIVHLNHNVRKHSFVLNEYSNLPARPRSLIRVFVVRMKTFCILRFPKCVSEYSDQTVRMRRLIGIFARRMCPKVLCCSFIIDQVIFKGIIK